MSLASTWARNGARISSSVLERRGTVKASWTNSSRKLATSLPFSTDATCASVASAWGSQQVMSIADSTSEAAVVMQGIGPIALTLLCLRQFLQQHLGFLQVNGIKALSVPAIDRCQWLLSCV